MRKFVRGDRVRFTPDFLNTYSVPEWAVTSSAEVIDVIPNGYRVKWPVKENDGGYLVSTEQGANLMLAKDYYLDEFARQL